MKGERGRISSFNLQPILAADEGEAASELDRKGLDVQRSVRSNTRGKLNHQFQVPEQKALLRLSQCGNAQSCAQVGPKGILPTTAIGELRQQTRVQMVKDLLGGGG